MQGFHIALVDRGNLGKTSSRTCLCMFYCRTVVQHRDMLSRLSLSSPEIATAISIEPQLNIRLWLRLLPFLPPAEMYFLSRLAVSEPQPRSEKEQKRRNIFSHLDSTIKALSHPLRLRSCQKSNLKVRNEEVASESSLCSTCNSVFVLMDYNESSYPFPETFPFTFATLEKSAQDDCFLCHRMLMKFRSRFDERLRGAPSSEAVKFRSIKPSFAGRLHLLAQFYFRIWRVS